MTSFIEKSPYYGATVLRYYACDLHIVMKSTNLNATSDEKIELTRTYVRR